MKIDTTTSTSEQLQKILEKTISTGYRAEDSIQESPYKERVILKEVIKKCTEKDGLSICEEELEWDIDQTKKAIEHLHRELYLAKLAKDTGGKDNHKQSTEGVQES